MTNEDAEKLSTKLNILISISLRQLLGNKDFSTRKKRKQGIGDLACYLSDMGLDAKDIADILGASVESIRTLLTPKRRN